MKFAQFHLNRRSGAVFAALLLFVIVLGCKKKETVESTEPQEVALAEVGVCTLKAAPTPIISTFPGRVVANDTAEIRPQINGIILKVNFESGDLVREGDVLYEIDASSYEATVLKAQARLDNLIETEKRFEQLIEKQAASEKEYQDAVAQRKEAEAALNLAKIDLEHCKITATMDGVIDGDFTSKRLGELVQIGQTQPLAIIRKLDPIKVEVNPSVRAILRTLKEFEEYEAKNAQNDDVKNSETKEISRPATIDLEDGSRYSHEGVLNEVGSTVQSDLGTIKFRALFPNPNRFLIPGMFVHLNIKIAERENGLLLPPEAIFRDPKSVPYVWVVGPDSKVERRNIVTNHYIDGKCLVDEGLNDGERVVVVGSQYVYEGCQVNAREVSNDSSANQVESAPKGAN